MQAIDLFTLLFPPEKPLEEAKIIVRGRFPDEIPVIARYLNKELYFHAEILFTKEITNEQAVACLNRAIDAIFADDYDGPNYIGKFPGCEVFIPYNRIKYFERCAEELSVKDVITVPKTENARLLKCSM